jgi:sugar phosphate isomerase/epimerase
VREALATRDPLPLGLWLSARAAGEIADADDARRVRDRLAAAGLVVVGLNGFPFGDFHQARVKHAVYRPDWTKPERLAFTLHLARTLVELLPEGTRCASISTLPLGWRTNFSTEGCGAGVGLAASLLERAADGLADIEASRGVRLTLDLEPEPGCVLDRSEHVVELFDRCLRGERRRRHLGVCHDICHAAVMFEPQEQALAAYRSAGIRVGKVQISSAPECDGSVEAVAQLARFGEPRYLHQTCVRERNGATRFFEDLPDALPHAASGVARTHFHVPIHLDRIGALGTTRAEIGRCLAALASDDPPALEIETYAWSVLPDELRPAELAEGIAAEWLSISGEFAR